MNAAKAGTTSRRVVERVPDKFELPADFTQEPVGKKIHIKRIGSDEGIAIPMEHFPSVAVALKAFATAPVVAVTKTKDTPVVAAAPKPAAKPAAKPATKAAKAAPAPAEQAAPLDAWVKDLPKESSIGDRIKLVLTTVELDDKKADRIIGKPKKGSKGRQGLAYEILVDGKHTGYVLAAAEKKFVIVAPDLSPDKTSHRGFKPALQRIEMLTNYKVA